MLAGRAHARDVRDEIRILEGKVETADVLARDEVGCDCDVTEMTGAGVERTASDGFANVTEPSAQLRQGAGGTTVRGGGERTDHLLGEFGERHRLVPLLRIGGKHRGRTRGALEIEDDRTGPCDRLPILLQQRQLDGPEAPRQLG